MLASWVCWGRRCSFRLASEPPLPGALSEKEHLPVRRLALARLQMLSFCVRAAPCRQQAVAMMHV